MVCMPLIKGKKHLRRSQRWGRQPVSQWAARMWKQRAVSARFNQQTLAAGAANCGNDVKGCRVLKRRRYLQSVPLIWKLMAFPQNYPFGRTRRQPGCFPTALTWGHSLTQDYAGVVTTLSSAPGLASRAREATIVWTPNLELRRTCITAHRTGSEGALTLSVADWYGTNSMSFL